MKVGGGTEGGGGIRGLCRARIAGTWQTRLGPQRRKLLERLGAPNTKGVRGGRIPCRYALATPTTRRLGGL